MTPSRPFATSLFAAIAVCGIHATGACAADGASPLAGKVVATTGEPLAGIPIKAWRDNNPITIAVYTDATGEYSFPAWSALTTGAYSVGIDLPDFEKTTRPATIAADATARIDFALTAKPLAYEDATASEIVAGLPGSDHQKTLFSQCGNCHTLQWALATPRDKQDWTRVILKMAGQAGRIEQPGTYAFSQPQFIEPLADYLTQIRGPGSSDQIPFKQRPRPTEAASTNLVVTEYALARGGERELFMLRGDNRFVWPHDVITNERYAYYTDHFSYLVGRVDLKTGANTEIPFELPQGAGRGGRGDSDGRPGNPGGGAHELQFDHSGNVIVGMDNGTVKYDPKTGAFLRWPVGSAMFGLDPQGNVWNMRKNGELIKLDSTSETSEITRFVIPKNAGIYDMDTDSRGRTHLYIWREGKIGLFDPATVKYEEFKAPTPMSGPRRGQIDGQDRLWAAEFYAGQILLLDADKKQLREYPLINGGKPYTAPFAAPYSVSADDKNGIIWTNDFNSSRLYRIDMASGQSTEYLTPSNYELRDLKVDKAAARPTVWLPAYRPPSKLVKVEMR